MRRDRYDDGRDFRVAVAVLALRAAPDDAAERTTELLFGETFTVYDENGAWAWGQCQTDGYVGYAPLDTLAANLSSATHEVAALRSHVFAGPDLKTEPVRTLHLTSRVEIRDQSDDFVLTDAGGWLYKRHIAEIGKTAKDPVATARRFLGTPYLWGGRSSFGLDCSALVQLALARAGRLAPRDTDQQEHTAGRAVDGGLAAARPGDLLYLKGHVAILAASDSVIHANAHHMAVAEEPLGEFLDRMASMKLEVRTVRRP